METITRLKQKFSPSNPSASLQKSTQSWADECENDAAVNNTLNFSAGVARTTIQHLAAEQVLIMVHQQQMAIKHLRKHLMQKHFHNMNNL